jgi:hypothetical protein
MVMAVIVQFSVQNFVIYVIAANLISVQNDTMIYMYMNTMFYFQSMHTMILGTFDIKSVHVHWSFCITFG